MRSGVILAGGRSTRFDGGDKALADLAGTPMVRRVADRLADVVDELVVNCRSEQVHPIVQAMEDYPRELRVAEDPEPDLGPVGGIRTGLRAVRSTYALVVACDMPFVSPALALHLFERADGHDAAVPRLDDGWYQTTQAVYRAAAMADACEDALGRGVYKITEPLFALDFVVVEESEVLEYASLDTFENVNTRGELDAAAAKLAGS